MKSDDLSQFNRYLLIYKKNPKSRIFSSLAESYRKMGKTDKALQICQKGLKIHPQSVSGHIALALIQVEMKQWELASKSLETAIDLNPENIFAHKLLARIYLQLKNPEKTLRAYKMLLLLDPKNKKASQIVKKLEAVVPPPHDESGFSFKTLKEIAKQRRKKEKSARRKKTPTIHPISKPKNEQEIKIFEMRINTAQDFINRGKIEKAENFLREMKNIYEHQKTFREKLKILESKIPKKSATKTKPETTKDAGVSRWFAETTMEGLHKSQIIESESDSFTQQSKFLTGQLEDNNSVFQSKISGHRKSQKFSLDDMEKNSEFESEDSISDFQFGDPETDEEKEMESEEEELEEEEERDLRLKAEAKERATDPKDIAPPLDSAKERRTHHSQKRRKKIQKLTKLLARIEKFETQISRKS